MHTILFLIIYPYRPNKNNITFNMQTKKLMQPKTILIPWSFCESPRVSNCKQVYFAKYFYLLPYAIIWSSNVATMSENGGLGVIFSEWSNGSSIKGSYYWV